MPKEDNDFFDIDIKDNNVVLGDKINNSEFFDVLGDDNIIINYDLDGDTTGGLDLLNGNGTDSELKISQVNRLMEDDKLISPEVENKATFKQEVTSKGGSNADSGDGIDANEGANYTGSTGGDMEVTAKSIASADATSIAEAFNQDLSVGQNTQTNVAKAEIVGHDDFFADGIDTNKPFTSSTKQPNLDKDDGNHTDVGDNILNGNGTDTQFEVDQVNVLSDMDVISNPSVLNNSSFTQDVDATGGSSSSEDGIEGLFDYKVGDDVSVDALTSASADAVGAASAFNQNIVMGANVQANGVDVSIVGGSSAVSLAGDDDA